MFKYVINIFFNPENTWPKISQDATMTNCTFGYAYIFIALTAISRWFNEFFWLDKPLIDSIIAAFSTTTALFLSIYMSAFICKYIYKYITYYNSDIERSVIFIALNSTIIYIVDIINWGFSEIFFIAIFRIFLIKTIYESCESFFTFNDKDMKIKFTISTTISTLATYWLIEMLISHIITY